MSKFTYCSNSSRYLESCFDDLRVGKDHVSRKPSDTYYLNENTVLRTHTSAHQTHFISSGIKAFLCTGDVYRRDEIDSSHYPIFHQMEGVRIFDDNDFPKGISIIDSKKIIEDDLKNILTGLAKHLFGNVEMRWRNDYFPFTEPSFELEILFNGDWLEVLGCGVIHDEVMNNSGKPNKYGWAFGLGLERLAMILFDIPDIRLFWSKVFHALVLLCNYDDSQFFYRMIDFQVSLRRVASISSLHIQSILIVIKM
jgi:phenylalanyl-tRNA synthetase alpha chain